MFSCQECGSRAKRRRRVGAEKLFFNACFICGACGAEVRKYRSLFQFLQPYVDCPLCGTVDLGKPRSRDRIDRLTRNPFRHILHWLGAPLYHCHFCRYQFYDYRPRHAKPARPTLTVAVPKDAKSA